MTSNYDSLKNWRRNTKIRLVEAFGGLCGMSKFIGNISDVSVKKRMKKEGLIP